MVILLAKVAGASKLKTKAELAAIAVIFVFNISSPPPFKTLPKSIKKPAFYSWLNLTKVRK
jgi:hypothetical protein